MKSEKLFLVDEQSGICMTYDEVYRLSSGESIEFCPEIRKGSLAGILSDLLSSLFCDQPITVFDEDFSKEEIGRLTGDPDHAFALSGFPVKFKVSSEREMADAMGKLQHWSITLFTSGTTGLPKKVTHSFNTFTRAVKTGERYKDDIWGFAYNPTHMAGLQVLFQALLNENTLVNIFNGNREFILDQLEKHQITHISATPTFYRLLLPFERPFPSIRQLTSGGEKFSEQMTVQLHAMFPEAKFTNVYASTEAGSLFAAEGEAFTIRGSFRDLVRITEGELMIHRSLTGHSDSISLQGDWYPTGDLVEVITEEPLKFRFVSRRNEMINIGGYKVNPTEVEEAMLLLEGIADARVFAKKNSVTGNLLCAEVALRDESITEPSIRKQLEGKLQDFKIPRIIRFVKEIDRTRTGKKTRN